MSSRQVIDANVLIAANHRGTHASLKCAAAAARYLLEAQEGVILEDDADLALAEYKRYAHMSGQPGAGDRFFQWFMRARWTRYLVERVSIGERPAEVKSHVPSRLHGFDPSDHKWIAIYLQGNGDRIVNATDSDWKEAAVALESCGVIVHELCPDELKQRP